MMQLFDHLIGDLPEMQRHIEAERPGGLEIDEKLELGRLLHWQVAGFGTGRRSAEQVDRRVRPPTDDQRHEPRRAAADMLKSRRGRRVLHADEHGLFASEEQPRWVVSMSAVTAPASIRSGLAGELVSFAFFLLP